MMKKILFILFLFSSVCASADMDFPKPTGYVNDFANILSSSEIGTLTEIAENLEQKTKAEIAIVTIKTVKPFTIEEYAVRLFEKWGIGKKGKDNGVLLLVAVADREVKIEAGYGLEGILPDGLCGEIIRNYIIPEFKNGRYGSGVISGVRRITGVLTGEKSGKEEIDKTVSDITGFIKTAFFVIFIIIFVLANILRSFFPHRRRHWYSGGNYSSWGGYSGGSFGGGGFGGFGGGSSGGGGAVGRW